MASAKRRLSRTALIALLLIPVGLLFLYRTPPQALFTGDARNRFFPNDDLTLGEGGGTDGGAAAELLSKAIALSEDMQRQGRILRERLASQETQLSAGLAQQLEGESFSPGRRGALASAYPPSFTRCHHGDWDGYKEDAFPLVKWTPRKGKFMLAACYDGGYSNRMLCITFLLHIAALLQRRMVLLPWPGMILPHQGGDEWITFDLASVIDVDFMASCAATGDAALTWDAFRKEHKGTVGAAGLCFESPIADPTKFKQPCGWAIDHGAENYNISVDFKGWVNVTNAIPHDELMKNLWAAGDPDIVWVLGTHNNIPHVWNNGLMRPSWPYTPVERTCNGSFFQPTPAIMLAAKRFVAGYTGEKFAAIHLRRNDFIDHLTLDTKMDCQYGDPGCFTLSIPQLAKCLDRALEAKGLSLLFVATDATLEEIELLKELLRGGGKTVIRIPRITEVHKHRWYQGLPPNDEMVYSVVEKTICAMATVYISSFYSTFSQDIQRLRYDWNLDTCHDHLICRLD